MPVIRMAGWVLIKRHWPLQKGKKQTDQKESFNSGPLNIFENLPDPRAYEFCYKPTLWHALGGCERASWTYHGAMEVLGLLLSYIGEVISHLISSLCTLHKLPTVAHTDYGSLTVLLRESGRFGLQISH